MKLKQFNTRCDSRSPVNAEFVFAEEGKEMYQEL